MVLVGICTLAVVGLAILVVLIQRRELDLDKITRSLRPIRRLGWLRFRRAWSAEAEIVELRLYPVKSCRGFSVKHARLLPTGLDLDRQWMLADGRTGRFQTIRQLPQLTLIKSALDQQTDELVLSVPAPGEPDAHVRIPAHPDPSWLDEHATLCDTRIWTHATDAYRLDAGISAPLSRFLGRDVYLLYKGPSRRVLGGNAAPDKLGREGATAFADDKPILLTSTSSLAALNVKLDDAGVAAVGMERFRPNIVISGTAPWQEDSWKTLEIVTDAPAGRQRSVAVLDVVARCGRCSVPNVDPDTAQLDKRQPFDTMMTFRVVDAGLRSTPCFGMLCVPPDGEVHVAVGMKVRVLETTTEHRYIKQ